MMTIRAKIAPMPILGAETRYLVQIDSPYIVPAEIYTVPHVIKSKSKQNPIKKLEKMILNKWNKEIIVSLFWKANKIEFKGCELFKESDKVKVK